MNDHTIFQAMFEHATTGVLVANAAGEILKTNPFLEELFGYSRGELVGQAIEVLLPQVFRQAHIKHRAAYFHDPKSRSMGEGIALFGKCKDGSEFPVEISLGHTRVEGEPLVIAFVNDVSHAKKTEGLLRESNRRYSTLINNLPGMAYRCRNDENWTLEFANEGCYDITGYLPDEFLGNGKVYFGDLILPKDKARVWEEVQQATRKKKPYKLEYRIRNKDGQVKWVWEQGEGVLGENGNVDALEGFLTDITELKESETLSLDILKIVEESLNEIYIFDAATLKFIQVNKGARQNLGYTLEEIQQLTPIDIKPSFTKKAFLKTIKPLLEGKQEILIFETTHERKDKTTYPVEVHLQYSSIGDQPVFVAFILDISERKKSEKLIHDYSAGLEQKVADRTQELAESEAKLKDAQAIAKLAYWEWNEEVRLITGSPGLSHLFGYEKHTHFTPKSFMKHIHPSDFPTMKKWMKNAWSRGKGDFTDFRVIDEKGNEKYLSAFVNHAERNAAGRVVKLFGVAQDVTLRKQAENQLETALQKEQELSELKSRFVSMASHEFRTPLTSILASADLIGMYSERGTIEKQQKHVQRIKSSVNNLTSILNDFLSLEKLESGKIECNPVQVHLEEFIGDVLEEIHLIAKPDQYIRHIHSGGKTVSIDQHLVKNILINLLSNAIKYSPNGEDVHLLSENSNGHLLIQVKDQGIGIPAKDQERMFSRFFRASNANHIKGTGLGLTIVKRYLDLMGGSISFTSVPNEGTVFEVGIPVG